MKEGNGKKRIYIYIYDWVTLLDHRLTEHCKSTIIKKIKTVRKDGILVVTLL